MVKKRKRNLSMSDKIILNSGYILLGIFLLAIIIPLAYIVIASFTDPTVLSSEGITFDFSKWSLDGYKRVLQDDMILRGFLNSIFYSISYAVISVAVTLMAAYPLSKDKFVGKTFINTLYVITMFLGGGLMLYQFVAQWNGYFDAMIYLDDSKLQPLQLVIRSILIQNSPSTGMIADIQNMAEMSKMAELLKYSTIVISSLPLLIMYPFFQKYFDKGIMMGSVKG